jgi:uncharacterized protein (DUF2236 family)
MAGLIVSGRSTRLQIQSNAEAIDAGLEDGDVVALFAESVEMFTEWQADMRQLPND